MNVYRCKLRRFDDCGYEWRANVMLLDDHKDLGGQAGEMCVTSAIKSIDFERGIIVTKNSIYIIKGRMEDK